MPNALMGVVARRPSDLQILAPRPWGGRSIVLHLLSSLPRLDLTSGLCGVEGQPRLLLHALLVSPSRAFGVWVHGIFNMVMLSGIPLKSSEPRDIGRVSVPLVAASNNRIALFGSAVEVPCVVVGWRPRR